LLLFNRRFNNRILLYIYSRDLSYTIALISFVIYFQIKLFNLLFVISTTWLLDRFKLLTIIIIQKQILNYICKANANNFENQ